MCTYKNTSEVNNVVYLDKILKLNNDTSLNKKNLYKVDGHSIFQNSQLQR